MKSGRGLPFISGPKPELLILGSFPGERSLQARQYYAHPQNSFWKIMGMIFGNTYEESYERRLEIIRMNKLALWDVLLSCERQGSMDGSIIEKGSRSNDLEGFFRDHPTVMTICFNGQKAAKLFRKIVQPGLAGLPQGLSQKVLPSTSPAYASMSLEAKAALWALALKKPFSDCHLE